MSFEGYYQRLCKNGHLSHTDVYEHGLDKCYECKTEFIWKNLVDQTNEDIPAGEDGGPAIFVIEKEAIVSTCPTCQYKKQVASIRYKIPVVRNENPHRTITDPCCNNENRNFNGGCDSCGDPTL